MMWLQYDSKIVSTVKPPLSSLLTNGHLLLPGTIWVCGGQWCMTCVFSMQPQSLHPVASPSSGFCKDAKCLLFALIGTWLYAIYIFLSNGHFLSYGHPLVPCCPDKRGFTVLCAQSGQGYDGLHVHCTVCSFSEVCYVHPLSRLFKLQPSLCHRLYKSSEIFL